MVLTSCEKGSQLKQHWLGHIEAENSFSKEGFKLCGKEVSFTQSLQYQDREKYAGYYGGSKAITKFVEARYDSKKYSDSGYLTIRFVLNCEGETGRFVIEEANLDFEEYEFSEEIKKELLGITMDLDDWRSLCFEDKNRDAYLYISYKILDGKIIEILP